MLLDCAKCGAHLTPQQADYCVAYNLPPGCGLHLTDVIEEAQSGHSMWPSDWHGHASTDNRGRWYIAAVGDDYVSWHELPSDDGDYDVFLAHMEDDLSE